MTKKLLIALLLLGTVASYGLLGDKETFKEKVANDKNAETAVKFSKYIFDYSKKNNSGKFYNRFHGVPQEDREYFWNIFSSINSLPKADRVTVPAMGKAKRYVYYNIDGKKYRFTVSLIKKRWQFREVQEMKNK